MGDDTLLGNGLYCRIPPCRAKVFVCSIWIGRKVSWWSFTVTVEAVLSRANLAGRLSSRPCIVHGTVPVRCMIPTRAGVMEEKSG
jgi:hypothetical protein